MEEGLLQYTTPPPLYTKCYITVLIVLDAVTSTNFQRVVLLTFLNCVVKIIINICSGLPFRCTENTFSLKKTTY